MNFVYPNFLWALLLLAIPVIIHLFHFRRYKKVLFPNVRFLQSVQKETQNVKKLRNLLVLISRLLAVAFLVFAFAQPYIPLNNKKIHSTDQLVGIYIDNSFSMENEGSNGPLIEEAKEKARQVVRAYQASDRFLISSNTRMAQRPVNQDDAIAAIDAIQISKISKSLNEVVGSIENSLTKNGVADRKIFVFSDLQKHQSSLPTTSNFDSSLQAIIIPVESNAANNVSIDTAWFESPVLHLNEPIVMFVKISNHGSNSVSNASLYLDINNERKAVSGFDLTENGSATVQLGFSLNLGGWQNAKLSIEDAPITFDDNYFLSFNLKSNINILVANGAEQSVFLNKAFGRDGYYKVANVQSGNIDLSTLKTTDLLVLNEVPQLSSGLVSAISDYVSDGGSLLIVPSKAAANGYLQNLSQAMQLPTYGQIQTQKKAIGKIDLSNPLFEKVFEKMPDNVDMPKVLKYYQMETAGKTASILLKMANESAFLTSSKHGSGNVYQLSVPLNDDWSNFQKHGFFPPLMLKMSMNRSVDYSLSYTIDNHNLFKAVPEIKNRQGEVKLVGEKAEWVPVLNGQSSSQFVDAGFDDLSAETLKLMAGDSLFQLVSFNYSREESGNEFYEADELQELLPGAKITKVENAASFVNQTIGEMQFGKQFWKLCIILALIFLAIEILLLRFWPTESKTAILEKNIGVV
ncbi:MAG: BatA domain-containing protein [Flavobacteriales bacterium]|nr:BatA domain-containing protein [Flavobacteriales bacterium]